MNFILNKHITIDDSRINPLEYIFVRKLFEKEIALFLTDRGTLFVCAADFEIRYDEIRRMRIYYCDLMQSRQKGSLENYHIELRYICPKEVNLYR